MLAICRLLLSLAMLWFIQPIPAARAADPGAIRIGLVKFGSLAWEVAVMRQQFARQGGDFALELVDLANPAAGEVALQAGAVDLIMTDFLWVARQRASGQKITFIPHNALLGDVLVPPGSGLRSLGDLDGKRLGIAGGPIDKSWLLLRAYGRKLMGRDLADLVHPIYGAAPLLSQEIAAGRLDAVLTFWPFAVRLESQGYRSLLSLAEVTTTLGIAAPVPVLGFALLDAYAEAHQDRVGFFLAAIGRADRELAQSDKVWQEIRSQTGAENDAVLVALRDRFRQGLVADWLGAAPAKAGSLFALLAELGGVALTGGATSLPRGTFWIEAAL